MTQVQTVETAANAFLSNIRKSRRPLTHRAYSAVLKGFLTRMSGTIQAKDPIGKLTERHAFDYMQEILDLAPASRQLHAAALRRFYTFVAGNDWAVVSGDRLNFLFSGGNVLSPVAKKIQYDKVRVKAFLEWVRAWDCKGNTRTRRIRNLRDRAFILTLADSGLRVHEACKLVIKDIDFELQSGIVIGKGNKQARFKISAEALEAVQAYLGAREALAVVSPDQPVFSSHARYHRQSIQHMTTRTGENIIHALEMKIFGEKTLTCHTLRHRFVTRLLETTKNLKTAQELARHTNINVTERYAHLLDEELDADFNMAFNS